MKRQMDGRFITQQCTKMRYSTLFPQERPFGEAIPRPADLLFHPALTLALHSLEEGFQVLHLPVPVVQLPPQVVNGDAVPSVPVPQALVLLLLETQLLLSLMQVSLQEARYVSPPV